MELQIEKIYMKCGSVITIYGSGRTYKKIERYEGENNEKKSSSL